MLIIACFVICFAYGQDMQYTKKIVEKLSSKDFFGRGYMYKGDSIAADYLSKQMQLIGLKAYDGSYFQNYTTSIVLMPKKPLLVAGTDTLNYPDDYIVIPNTKSINGRYKITWLDKEILTNKWVYWGFRRKDVENSFMAIDSTELKNAELYQFAQFVLNENFYKAKGVLINSVHLKNTARTEYKDYTTILIKDNAMPLWADSLYISVQTQLKNVHKTQNVIGYLQGKSDSVVVFCAHYDHLGVVGEALYPGANDNASGVSMVLNLAKYYKQQKNRQYTFVFMLFSGEEAGLLGSKHYVNNPLFPLEKIKMVLNYDMVATGTEGLYLFNGLEYPMADSIIHSINNNEQLIPEIVSTKATFGSDHAMFYLKGVPGMFFYTKGGSVNYHLPSDVEKNLLYQQYKAIYKLTLKFVEQF